MEGGGWGGDEGVVVGGGVCDCGAGMRVEGPTLLLGGGGSWQGREGGGGRVNS